MWEEAVEVKNKTIFYSSSVHLTMWTTRRKHYLRVNMIQHAWLRLVHKHEVCREVEEAGVYFCTCGSMEHQHGDSALHYKAANESASRYNWRLLPSAQRTPLFMKLSVKKRWVGLRTLGHLLGLYYIWFGPHECFVLEFMMNVDQHSKGNWVYCVK